MSHGLSHGARGPLRQKICHIIASKALFIQYVCFRIADYIFFKYVLVKARAEEKSKLVTAQIYSENDSLYYDGYIVWYSCILNYCSNEWQCAVTHHTTPCTTHFCDIVTSHTQFCAPLTVMSQLKSGSTEPPTTILMHFVCNLYTFWKVSQITSCPVHLSSAVSYHRVSALHTVIHYSNISISQWISKDYYICCVWCSSHSQEFIRITEYIYQVQSILPGKVWDILVYWASRPIQGGYRKSQIWPFRRLTNFLLSYQWLPYQDLD